MTPSLIVASESEINFFELVIDLLQDESILYIDLIDVITYLQHTGAYSYLERVSKGVFGQLIQGA